MKKFLFIDEEIFASKNFLFIIITLLASILFLSKLWESDLPSLDSSVYASISREILRSGDWLTLHYPYSDEYKDFYQHPPLYFWLTAIAFKIFGNNDYAAKFFSSLMGMGTVIIVFQIALVIKDKWVAFFSSTILALTQFFVKYSRKSLLDAPLTFFISLSILFFLLARNKNNRVYYILCGVSIGLAVMTKGIPGFSPVIIIILYAVFSRNTEIIYKKGMILAYLFAIITIAPWILLQIIYHGDKFFNLYIKGQVMNSFLMGRGEKPEDFYHMVGGYLFYFKSFLISFLPWSPIVIIGFYRLIKNNWCNRKDFSAKYSLLIFSWFGVIFIGFSIARHKYDWYLLPLFPAAAIISGIVISEYFSNRLRSWAPRLLLLLTIALLILTSITPLNFDISRQKEFKSLVPYIRFHTTENERIIIYKMGYWATMARFSYYATRGISKPVNNPEGLLQSLGETKRKFYFLEKSEYSKLPGYVKEKINILYENNKYIFATNMKDVHRTPLVY